jgi:hypothetical protein
VQIPVDVIAVFGTPAAQAAKQATKTIPIVAISIGDPIGAGLGPVFSWANFARERIRIKRRTHEITAAVGIPKSAIV